MAPVIWEARKSTKIDLVLIHTGQHYDPLLSDLIIEQLQIPEPHYNLGIGSKSKTEQISGLLRSMGDLLLKLKPDLLIMQGDTNTVSASGIAARCQGVPVAHLEAGLRSLNETSMEELNRKIASVCALYHFAPTNYERHWLVKAGIKEENIFVTGNTVVDVLKIYESNIREKVKTIAPTSPGKQRLLVTIHRPDNVDNLENLKGILSALGSLSLRYDIILPAHPRLSKKLEETGLLSKIKEEVGISVTQPSDYITFIALLISSSLVITDSGGVQEEAAVFGRPTVTVRPTTPRWNTIIHGRNVLARPEKESILEAARSVEKSDGINPSLDYSILGDGTSGMKIISKILDLEARGLLKYTSPDFVGVGREEIAARLFGTINPAG